MTRVLIWPYLRIFSAAYAVGLIIGYVAIYTLDIDSSVGISLAVLGAAALYTAVRFMERYERPPNRREKVRLALGSLLASIAVSVAVGVATVLLVDKNDSLAATLESFRVVPGWIWAASAIAVYAVFFLLLYLSYGFVARKYFEMWLDRPRRRAA